MDQPLGSLSASPSSAGAPGTDGDLTGKTIGDFQILRRLGQGGMGQVYLAEQISLKRKVAVKFLKTELALNETSLRRFTSEAQNVAQLNHANIVQIYATGGEGHLHYMAMEFVEGLDLRDYLAKKGPPDLPLALKIMIQVASALTKAGEHNIAHRDIKPENILITRKGLVKVADFGLARCFSPDQQPVNLTQSGVAMGTPLYMSPEQVTGHGVDLRTDIYSFGVTCYHMLAGEPPFKGDTPFEVALQHVQVEPRPLKEIRPDLPPDLCAIVAKMMAKQPEQRYQTGRELLKDLNRLRTSLSQTLKGTKSGDLGLASSGAEHLSADDAKTLALPPPRRNWLPWAVGASIVLALGIGGALGWMRNRPAESPAAPAASGVSDPAYTPKKPVEKIDPKKEKENLLVKMAQDYADPGNDRDKVHLGLVHRVELAMFYLDERRYDDADRFFNELISKSRKVPAYNLLGRIGHAIVLGFQDKAAESTKLFEDIFDEKNRPMMYRGAINLVNTYPNLKRKIAEALDRNEANKETVPPSLQDLRRPGNINLPPVKPGRKQ